MFFLGLNSPDFLPEKCRYAMGFGKRSCEKSKVPFWAILKGLKYARKICAATKYTMVSVGRVYISAHILDPSKRVQNLTLDKPKSRSSELVGPET